MQYSRREFLRTSGGLSLGLLGSARSFASSDPIGTLTPLRLGPVPSRAIFSVPGYFVWCGSMIQDDSGVCHLFYSRWPIARGFNAWVTHSEIARASAEHPLGPYCHAEVVLPARGARFWDGHCTHNPNIHRFGNRYVLYYMGNRGDRLAGTGLNFSHRNHQRIGVATAPRPGGPWSRSDVPLVSPTDGGPDALCCTNPTVTQTPSGSYLMIYKGVGLRNPLPFGGPVVHLSAMADEPTGPFIKRPDPIFARAGSAFPAEDPFLWTDSGRFRVILKDNAGALAGGGRALVEMASADGVTWPPASVRRVTGTGFARADGTVQSLTALERPQIWLKGGAPAVLFCAASIEPEATTTATFNVAIPLLGEALVPAGIG